MIKLLTSVKNIRFSASALLFLLLGILVLIIASTDIPLVLWERTGPFLFPMLFLGSIFFGNVFEAIHLKFFKHDVTEIEKDRLVNAIANSGSLLAHIGFLGTVWGIMLSMTALGKNGSVDPSQVLSALALAVTTTLIGSGLDHIGRLFVIYVLGGSANEED